MIDQPDVWRPYTDTPAAPIERCLMYQDGSMFWGGYSQYGWHWLSQFGDGSEYIEAFNGPLDGLYWRVIEPPQAKEPT
jgi:hypothetical protein